MEKNKKFLFFAATLIIIAAMAEGALRLYYHLRNSTFHPSKAAYDTVGEYYGKYTTFPMMEYSQHLGFRPIPNFKGKGYNTNADSFRYDITFPQKKPKGEYRIFVVGGSTAWGAGVKQDQLYSRIAEQELKAQCVAPFTARVISAGVGAFVSAHERILIIDHIAKFEPDLIVMFDGWNDIWYGYQGILPGETIDYLNVAPPLQRAMPDRISIKPKKLDTLKPPSYNSHFFKLHFLLKQTLFRLKAVKEAEEFEQLALSPESVLEAYLKNIHVVKDFSSRINAKLMIYLQPSIYSTKKNLAVYEKELMERYKFYVNLVKYNRTLYKLFRERVPRDAKKENYLFSDADNSIYREVKAVFADQVHFGDRGNRLIGKHLAKILKPALAQKGLTCINLTGAL